MLTIALMIAAVLAVALGLWRMTRRVHQPSRRAVPQRRVESSQANADDGSTLLTGVVIGSMLFGGDSDAQPPADSANPPDASGASGNIEGGSDGGFDTGGDF
jgi:hypothetical protein